MKIRPTLLAVSTLPFFAGTAAAQNNSNDLRAAIFEITSTGETLAACGMVHLLPGHKPDNIPDFTGQMYPVLNGRDPKCPEGAPDTYSPPQAPILNAKMPNGGNAGGPTRVVITGPRWDR